MADAHILNFVGSHTCPTETDIDRQRRGTPLQCIVCRSYHTERHGTPYELTDAAWRHTNRRIDHVSHRQPHKVSESPLQQNLRNLPEASPRNKNPPQPEASSPPCADFLKSNLLNRWNYRIITGMQRIVFLCCSERCMHDSALCLSAIYERGASTREAAI